MALLRTAVAPRALPRLALAARYASSSAAAPAPSSSQRLTVTHSTNNSSGALLGNIEATWKSLSPAEQSEVFQKLEQVQKKDWKELTVDEKKAAYYVAYGPHGPRTPLMTPGNGMRVLLGTGAAVATAISVFLYVRTRSAPPPRTMTKEWQEGVNEVMKEANINPITGISSDGYKGRGMTSLP